MILEQKGIERLKFDYTVDQHNMNGKCIENCILLKIGDRVILKFKKLSELEKMECNGIKFDSNEESEIFKEKVKNIVREIRIKYEIGECEDF